MVKVTGRKARNSALKKVKSPYSNQFSYIHFLCSKHCVPSFKVQYTTVHNALNEDTLCFEPYLLCQLTLYVDCF